MGFSTSSGGWDEVYDITAGIPAVVEDSAASSIAYYIREPNDSLIARYDSTNGMRYYHFDQLGSTRLITDSGGNVTDRYDYDAYGAVLWDERDARSIDQPYQYVGGLATIRTGKSRILGCCSLGEGPTPRRPEGSPGETRWATGLGSTSTDMSATIRLTTSIRRACCVGASVLVQIRRKWGVLSLSPFFFCPMFLACGMDLLQEQMGRRVSDMWNGSSISNCIRERLGGLASGLTSVTTGWASRPYIPITR